MLGAEFSDDLRISTMRLGRLCLFANDLGKVRNLPGPMNPRMSCEDLLDEGRSGSRHAEDENGQPRGISHPLPLPDKVGAKQRLDASQILRFRSLVVPDLLSFQCIPLQEVLESPLMHPKVAIRLPQREVHDRAILA